MWKLLRVVIAILQALAWLAAIGCLFGAMFEIRLVDRLPYIAGLIVLVFLATRRFRPRPRTLGKDLIGDLAKSLDLNDYLDVDDVSFLVTAVINDGNPEWEIWMQGARDGRHLLEIDAATSQGFTHEHVTGPHLRASLESKDDELVSFFLPRQWFPEISNRTVEYDISATSTTQNPGQGRRPQLGTKLRDEVTPLQRLAGIGLGHLARFIVRDDDALPVIRFPIRFPER